MTGDATAEEKSDGAARRPSSSWRGFLFALAGRVAF
jgi:hypothetical protein